MKKYLVGILYYGPIDREHDRCVRALAGHPLIHDVFDLQGCPYIDMGRSMIATRVLDDPELGGVMFIDHDMIFEPEAVETCILGAESVAGTCGGAYSMRQPGRMIGAIDGSQLPPGDKVVFFDGGQMRPAQYLGMGMTAISRSVLVRLVKESQDRHDRQQANLKELRRILTGLFDEPNSSVSQLGDGTLVTKEHALSTLETLVPELKIPDLPRLGTGLNDAPVVPFFSHLQRLMPNSQGLDGYYFGEDVSFCARSRDAGLPVMLDTRVRVYHKGAYHYGIEDVGMQVPYCTRLEAIEPADGKEPEPRVALHSKDEHLKAALEAANPEHRLSAPLLPGKPQGASSKTQQQGASSKEQASGSELAAPPLAAPSELAAGSLPLAAPPLAAPSEVSP